jgi:periplasmic protein CpxP/Spy
MTLRPSLCSVVMVAALISVPAFAQSSGTPAPAAPAPAAAAPSAPERAAAARVEARIKQLYTQLHITKAEDAQWNAFADVMRDNAHAIDEAAEKRSEDIPTMNAVQDLKSYEALAEAHVERLQKLIPAFEALYGAMSPEQQKIADGVFRGRAERSHRRHG